MRMRILLLVAFLAFGSTASAMPSLFQDGKAGPFMFNFQIGPAIGARNAINMGAIVLDFGFAVDPGRHAYILFPLQFQFADVNVSIFGTGADYTVGYVMVPVGFQYDIAIPGVPGLYLSPRIVGGYVAATESCNGCNTTNAGFIAPELTAKLVLGKRWNVGLVPFSLPIFIHVDNGNTTTSIDYRILFFGGVNF
ncbi:MAG TPA: hypothetical protein VN947_03645 [Polyangia bacterium]|nr:hypothetical protein [Polyangia bacterium]